MSRMSARIYMTGDKQVERMLRNMQTKDADRISKRCIRAQLNEGVKEVRKGAPRGETKALAKSVGARLERKRKTHEVVGKFGINVGKRSKKAVASRGKTHRAPHGHLVALGTKLRTRKRIGGKFAGITNPTAQQLRTGRMNPNKFVSEGTARARPKMAAAAQRKAALEIKKYNQRRR